MQHINRYQKYTRRVPIDGFTLLEVLVAIVILALGLLGFAALQVTGIRYASNAALRFNVSSQVNDIMDKIRANKVGFTAGSYFGSAGTSSTACITASCTTAQMAAADLKQWNDANARMLPGGSGTVTAVAGDPTKATITVSWTERSSATNTTNTTMAVTKSYSLTFAP